MSKLVPREITFLLLGPRTYWLSWDWREYSYTGAVKVARTRRIRPLGGLRLPFSLEARLHYLYSQRSDGPDEPYRWDVGKRRTELENCETNVQSVVLTTRLPNAHYSDEAFLSDARAAIEDLCLLVSFLSQGLVNWFSYSQSGHGYYQGFARSVHPPRSVEPDQLDQMVPLQDAHYFLRRAFARLRKLRAKGTDLRLPLTYAFAAGEVSVTSQKFGVLFLGLEAARKVFKNNSPPGRRRDRAYGTCKGQVLKAVRGYAEEAQRRGRPVPVHWWTDKIGALDRPSFWQGLDRMLQRFAVGWKDLYPLPSPKKPTFIDVRNRLFHSGLSSEDENVFKETLRLRAVLQRLLLRWLGWQDLWNVPDPWTKHFVSGRKGLPEGEDLRLLRADKGRPRRTARPRRTRAPQ